MKLAPALQDFRLDIDFLLDTRWIVDDDAFRAMCNLVIAVTGRLAWTYSPPTDGSLPCDDVQLARIARLDRRKWRRIRPQLEEFFDTKGDRWHLNRPWLAVQGGMRAAIPLDIQRKVLAREGKRCSYCGTPKGPFEFDHIFPVSKGGSNDPSNLTLACQPCNRAKSDMTLAEWMASR